MKTCIVKNRWGRHCRLRPCEANHKWREWMQNVKPSERGHSLMVTVQKSNVVVPRPVYSDFSIRRLPPQCCKLEVLARLFGYQSISSAAVEQRGKMMVQKILTRNWNSFAGPSLSPVVSYSSQAAIRSPGPQRQISRLLRTTKFKSDAYSISIVPGGLLVTS